MSSPRRLNILTIEASHAYRTLVMAHGTHNYSGAVTAKGIFRDITSVIKRFYPEITPQSHIRQDTKAGSLLLQGVIGAGMAFGLEQYIHGHPASEIAPQEDIVQLLSEQRDIELKAIKGLANQYAIHYQFDPLFDALTMLRADQGISSMSVLKAVEVPAQVRYDTLRALAS